jgi:hypothetical protein
VPDLDWQSAGDRIDALIAASASGGVVAHERAEEIARLVADVYGAGLERLLDLLHEQGALTDPVVDALAADDLVAGLLLVHGLHPYPVETRIGQAVAHLGAELVGVSPDGVARVRIPPADGCGTSAAALRPAIEQAIEAVAPEIFAIELEEPPRAVIPVSSLFARLGETSAP